MDRHAKSAVIYAMLSNGFPTKFIMPTTTPPTSTLFLDQSKVKGRPLIGIQRTGVDIYIFFHEKFFLLSMEHLQCFNLTCLILEDCINGGMVSDSWHKPPVQHCRLRPITFLDRT